QDDADLALLEQVGGTVAHPRLGAAIGDQLEAEGRAVEVLRLLRVPDPELDVVGAVDREGVVRGAEVGLGGSGHCIAPESCLEGGLRRVDETTRQPNAATGERSPRVSANCGEAQAPRAPVRAQVQ